MDFYKQYPSGLKLIAHKIDGLYTVSFGVYVDVGCVKEDDKTNGLSHFIEHLVFKGTDKRTSLQISEAMDDIGANLNAFTAKDCTCFYTKSVSTDLEKCVDVLSDMYFNASIPQDELDKERGVVLEEINMCEDTPDDVCQDLIQQAQFFDQKMGQTILGNAENIKYCDRHSILEFKKKHYLPQSTVISVAGSFDYEQLDKLVESYFESNFAKISGTPQSELPVQYTNKFLHKFKDLEQSHLQWSWGTCAGGDDDFFVINMLSSILGGGFTSRLYQVIREQNGLVYTVYSYPSFYGNCGTLEFYAGLSPNNVGKCCQLVEQEINKIRSEGITQKELDRAKIQMVNGMYMSLENSMNVMRLYGRRLLKLGRQFDVKDEVARCNAVTLQQVNDAAIKYLTPHFASTYLGPEIADYDCPSKIVIK